MEPKENYIYLDHNATTVLRPSVLSKMAEVYGRGACNPSAMHSLGREAKAQLNGVRSVLAYRVDGEGSRIFFTSGATESNNIVLHSGWQEIFCSATEHDSVYKGPITKTIPVLPSGLLDIGALKQFLDACQGEKTLVSVQWANNETGVIQPIEEIAEIVHYYGAWFHVDGVQALGKIPLSFNKAGIDFLSLSAHKMGGPQGVGALVMKEKAPLSPLFFGGGQEFGFRSGTENLAGVLGFGAALESLDFEAFKDLGKQHHALEEDLVRFASAHEKEAVIVGKEARRLPNTTCIALLGMSNQSQLIYLDLRGIGVSIGSACSSSTVKSSRVLKNMGLSEDIVRSALRISSGWNTRDSDFVAFKEAWKNLILSQS